MGYSDISVLKFGSSVLSDDSSFSRAVHLVYQRVRAGHKVVAVTSAIGSTTDELSRRADRWSAHESHRAALLATGELSSAALLGLALDRAGIDARVLDASACRFVAEGPALEANPKSVDVSRIRRALMSTQVIVVPGFVARNSEDQPVLLGRGGSDYTALFLGEQLAAKELALIKDVAGVQDRDPKDPSHRRFRSISWDRALRLEAPVIQRRALEFARRERLVFSVSNDAGVGTVVGQTTELNAVSDLSLKRTRVAMIGCGQVGAGVREHLRGLSDRFDLVGIVVRHPKHYRGEPGEYLSDFGELLERDPEILIEVSGSSSAHRRVSRFLSRGHVVTADKVLVAEEGNALKPLALASGHRFFSSAAVGGAMPASESLDRALGFGPVEHIQGVLNGSTGIVLDEMSRGVSRLEAVAAARRAGALESDADEDLSGRDAARKLLILARRAFGGGFQLSDIDIQGVPADLEALSDPSARVRIVAEARLGKDGPKLSVQPRVLSDDNVLFDARSSWNRLSVMCRSGEIVEAQGAGAGRYPSAEAVIADVLRASELPVKSPSGSVSHGG